VKEKLAQASGLKGGFPAGTTLRDALDVLKDLHGLNIVIDAPGGQDIGNRPVRLEGRLMNVTVAAVLGRLVEQAGATYEVGPDAVTVRPRRR
jgi:hypothetical protein